MLCWLLARFPELPSRLPLLLERLQVSDDLVHLFISQLHIGHQTAHLDLLRITYPESQVVCRIGRCTRRQRLAAHQVSRSGPNFPCADVPPMVWQLTQELAKNTLRPAAALVSTEADCCCSLAHRSNSSGGCTTTRINIRACCVPQYSAQLPR